MGFRWLHLFSMDLALVVAVLVPYAISSDPEHIGNFRNVYKNQVETLQFVPTGQDFYSKFVATASPAIVIGGAKRWPAVRMWDNNTYLKSIAGNDWVEVNVKKIVSEKNDVSSMPFGMFLSSFLQEDLILDYQLLHGHPLLMDLSLPLMLQCEELVQRLTTVNLHISSIDNSVPLSLSSEDVLLVSITGSQKVYLFEPSIESEDSLLWSQEAKNLGQNLDLGMIEDSLLQLKSVTTLNPGDIFYIPKNSWFLIHRSRGRNTEVRINLNIFSFEHPPDLSSNQVREAYLQFIRSQPREIRCDVTRIKVSDHLNINFDDPESVLHLRLPKKNQRPADVILASGYSMPVMGFGTALLNESTYDAVKYAIQVGYRMVDTAYGYPHSEEHVGRAIRDSSVAREDMFIVSKLHPKFLGFEETLRGIEESLLRLNSTYMDAYLIHSIECDDFLLACAEGEPHGTWQDSWRAMEHAHELGKIRSLGVSNFDLRHVKELVEFARVPVSIVQNWFDPLNQDVAMRRFCAKHGIRYMGYSTLGSRWLMYGLKANPVLTSEVIVGIAGHYDYVASHVVLRWAIHVNVTVIPRSANRNHIEQNFRSLDISMHPSEIRSINRLGDWMEDMMEMAEDVDEMVDAEVADVTDHQTGRHGHAHGAHDSAEGGAGPSEPSSADVSVEGDTQGPSGGHAAEHRQRPDEL